MKQSSPFWWRDGGVTIIRGRSYPESFNQRLKERASRVAWMVKRLPEMWETQVRSLGQEDPLEKAMAAHSSILPWKSHGQRSLAVYKIIGLQKRWTLLSD